MKVPVISKEEAANIRRMLGPGLMRNLRVNSLMDQAEKLARQERGRGLTDEERARILPEAVALADEQDREVAVSDQLLADAAALADRKDAAGRVARAYLELERVTRMESNR